MQKIKALLKDDKDESHTYWTLVFLSIICGIFLIRFIDKEKTIIEALTHLQFEEIIRKLLKNHAEAPAEFHIMLHQILGHMTVTDNLIRKFYTKDNLFLSLIPLLNSPEIGIIQSTLTIIITLLMSVL